MNNNNFLAVIHFITIVVVVDQHVFLYAQNVHRAALLNQVLLLRGIGRIRLAIHPHPEGRVVVLARHHDQNRLVDGLYIIESEIKGDRKILGEAIISR